MLEMFSAPPDKKRVVVVPERRASPPGHPYEGPFYDYPIGQEDIRILSTNSWLNDNIINFFLM